MNKPDNERDHILSFSIDGKVVYEQHKWKHQLVGSVVVVEIDGRTGAAITIREGDLDDLTGEE